ncbi:MAG: sulfurtransferase complex subunit TusB [Promethearchaeota archaeon]
MVSVLYLLFKSPYKNFNGMDALMRVVKSQSVKSKVGVALLQDAVVSLRGVLSEKIVELAKEGIHVIALSEDLKARGIGSTVDGVQQVSYREIINIIMNDYDKVVSWG